MLQIINNRGREEEGQIVEGMRELFNFTVIIPDNYECVDGSYIVLHRIEIDMKYIYSLSIDNVDMSAVITGVKFLSESANFLYKLIALGSSPDGLVGLKLTTPIMPRLISPSYSEPLPMTIEVVLKDNLKEYCGLGRVNVVGGIDHILEEHIKDKGHALTDQRMCDDVLFPQDAFYDNEDTPVGTLIIFNEKIEDILLDYEDGIIELEIMISFPTLLRKVDDLGLGLFSNILNFLSTVLIIKNLILESVSTMKVLKDGSSQIKLKYKVSNGINKDSYAEIRTYKVVDNFLDTTYTVV